MNPPYRSGGYINDHQKEMHPSAHDITQVCVMQGNCLGNRHYTPRIKASAVATMIVDSVRPASYNRESDQPDSVFRPRSGDTPASRQGRRPIKYGATCSDHRRDRVSIMEPWIIRTTRKRLKREHTNLHRASKAIHSKNHQHPLPIPTPPTPNDKPCPPPKPS